MPTPFAFPEACPMKILQQEDCTLTTSQGQQQIALGKLHRVT